MQNRDIIGCYATGNVRGISHHVVRAGISDVQGVCDWVVNNPMQVNQLVVLGGCIGSDVLGPTGCEDTVSAASTTAASTTAASTTRTRPSPTVVRLPQDCDSGQGRFHEVNERAKGTVAGERRRWHSEPYRRIRRFLGPGRVTSPPECAAALRRRSSEGK